LLIGFESKKEVSVLVKAYMIYLQVFWIGLRSNHNFISQTPLLFKLYIVKVRCQSCALFGVKAPPLYA